MTEPRLERALEVYLRFCDADPQPAWSTFLEEHEELRDLLEPMHEEEDPEPASNEPGLRTMGDFTLEREVGRGGMGVVYRAVQRSVDRTVALKVLPAHLTLDPHSIARFQREATLAGRLDHPGIVDVYTVGSDEGSHFFAMELIEGASLSDVLDHLRQRRSEGDSIAFSGVDLREAVEAIAGPPSDSASQGSSLDAPSVFRSGFVESMVAIAQQVGDALRFAHDNQVLHRDVKPSNVMIRRNGRVVLTDFGLAQEEQLPSMTLTGQFVGTPHYVAPEQARGEKDRCGPAVDVFSLGATLYEMVTLQKPFPGESSVEVLRRITDEEPTHPAKHNRTLSSDLTAILLRALEKQPQDRYENAGAMAADLRAFLELRPIEARRAGPLRRAQRFVRRNKLLTVGAAIVFVSLATALGISLDAQARAEQAAQTAGEELKRREQTVDFLRWVLKSPDPMAMGPDAPLSDMLARADQRIADEFATQPEFRAEMRELLGETLLSLGAYPEATAQLEQVLAWVEQNDDDPIRLASVSGLLADSLPSGSERAAPLYESALRIYETQLGRGAKSTLRMRMQLVRKSIDNGRADEARELLREVEGFAIEGDPETRFDWYRTRATLHIYDADWPAASADLATALAVQGLPDDGWMGYVRRTALQTSLGIAAQQGDTERALEVSTEMIAYMVRVFGRQHPRLVGVYSDHGTILRLSGDHDAAEDPYQRSVEIGRATLTPPDAGLATSLNNLGSLYRYQHREDEAIELLSEAADMYAAVHGENHRLLAGTLDNIADVHRDAERYEEAMPIQRRSLAILREVHGDAHFETLCAFFRTARLEARCGEFDAARKKWKTAFPLLGEVDPRSQSRVLWFANDLRASLWATQPPAKRTEFLLDLAAAQRRTGRRTDAAWTALDVLGCAWFGPHRSKIDTAIRVCEVLAGREIELR